MKAGVVFVLTLLLMGCEYEGISPSTDVPVREIHYNFETGERVGTKTFAYDANNNLLYERFVNELNNNSLNDFEVVYERDGEGRLIKRMERYPDITSEYYVEETTYSGALKTSLKTYYTDNASNFSEARYYYTGTVLDSMRHFYTTPQGTTRTLSGESYKYDDQGRLIAVYYPDLKRVKHTIEYKGSTVERCIADYRCTFTEYNKAGQVVKISETDIGRTTPEVNEEYFYKGGRLAEKIWYTHAAYLVPGLVVTWKIKYEY